MEGIPERTGVIWETEKVEPQTENPKPAVGMLLRFQTSGIVQPKFIHLPLKSAEIPTSSESGYACLRAPGDPCDSQWFRGKPKVSGVAPGVYPVFGL